MSCSASRRQKFIVVQYNRIGIEREREHDHHRVLEGENPPIECDSLQLV